jgi:hypothetical protein
MGSSVFHSISLSHVSRGFWGGVSVRMRMRYMYVYFSMYVYMYI